MVKMCLFYPNPAGHARTDPIITTTCPSDHVHTFYGPLEFHANTTYNDLINVIQTPSLSTSPFVENQSLYWHPSIYQVAENGNGTETYTRLSDLESSPYYRWDKSVQPLVEAFPEGFRMIAGTTDANSNNGGETGANMLTECCDYDANGMEDCQSWDRLHFPSRSCAFVGIAFGMPTCWNGELGDTGNHRSHMTFTSDGTVAGPCPTGYDRRLPQIQLFVRILNYRGDLYRYQLSDGQSGDWHVDFFNGWQPGKLQEIIDGCPFAPDQEERIYNPPCGCTPGDDENGAESTTPFLTPNLNPHAAVCDEDVRRLIIDEATDNIASLPRGTNGSCNTNEPALIAKSWENVFEGLYLNQCGNVLGGGGGGDQDEDGEEDEQNEVNDQGANEEGNEENDQVEDEEGDEGIEGTDQDEDMEGNKENDSEEGAEITDQDEDAGGEDEENNSAAGGGENEEIDQDEDAGGDEENEENNPTSEDAEESEEKIEGNESEDLEGNEENEGTDQNEDGEGGIENEGIDESGDREWEEENDSEHDEAPVHLCEEDCETRFEQCFERVENSCQNEGCVARREGICGERANLCFANCEEGSGHRSYLRHS